MEINNTRMAKNLYNKVDAEKWMTIPKLSEISRTSFYDVDNLVLFDKELLDSAETEDTEIDLAEMFEEL